MIEMNEIQLSECGLWFIAEFKLKMHEMHKIL